MAAGSVLVVGAFALAGVATAALHAGRRRRRTARTARDLARYMSEALPRSLYPVVDPDRCIGSLSCLKACPEGEVLSFRDGLPVLLHAERCVGHGVCADECPVSAIRLVFGSPERTVLLPELRAGFESSRPGIHVVGELAGAPLLEPSMKQGLAVGELLASRNGARRDDRAVAVAIVGAGPAGLATAFALQSAGVTYRILERGAALSTLRSYPAGKRVKTRPVKLPGASVVARKPRATREELIADWMSALERGDIRVEEHTEVLAVDGVDGDFVLRTSQGPVRSRKVVLATGRSGSPRRLGVEGEDLPKVVRELSDPAAYRGRRALVVGGGDSAVEAAVALAHAGATDVVLCHRGEDLRRCGLGNRLDLEKLAGDERLRVLLRSRVKRIEEDTVSVATPTGDVALANDAVVLAIGGELPIGLLEGTGVKLRRYAGESPDADPGNRAAPGGWGRRAGPAVALALMPAALLVQLQKGWDYYQLDIASRLRSPLHPLLRPSSPFGIAMGTASAALLAVALAYALRKRSAWLLGRGSMRGWLHAHAIAGGLCLALAAVHASFSVTHALASATQAALVGLAATGFVGLYSGMIGSVVTFWRAAPQRAQLVGLCGSAGDHGGVAIEASPGPTALRSALGTWRVLHLALAAFVVVAVVAHVAVVVLFGYAFR